MILFSLFSGAVNLDTAESVSEAMVQGDTALDIPLEDPYYGKLIYYNNFEEASGFTVGESVVAEETEICSLIRMKIM